MSRKFLWMLVDRPPVDRENQHPSCVFSMRWCGVAERLVVASLVWLLIKLSAVAHRHDLYREGGMGYAHIKHS
jgi:hypothetical protein